MLSFLWAFGKTQKYYDVTDAVILWYGIVALVISWPIAYLFGYVLFCIKHTWKEMMYLKIEWKKILDKTTA